MELHLVSSDLLLTMQGVSSLVLRCLGHYFANVQSDEAAMAGSAGSKNYCVHGLMASPALALVACCAVRRTPETVVNAVADPWTGFAATDRIAVEDSDIGCPCSLASAVSLWTTAVDCELKLHLPTLHRWTTDHSAAGQVESSCQESPMVLAADHDEVVARLETLPERH